MGILAMHGNEDQYRELEHWEYDKPPTLFDLVENNIVTNILRICIHSVLRLYFKIYHRLETYKGDQLKALAPSIIVANHSSHLDVIALLQSFPIMRINQIRSLAAKDYFFRNPILRLLTFLIANTVPLERSKFDADCYSYCIKAIESGSSIIIFPEGTRSMDGKMKSFKAGIGMLAKRFNVPVIPAFIFGAYESYGKGHYLPKPVKLRVMFAQKVNYDYLENSKEGWLKIAQDLQDKVAALSQEFQKKRT